MQFKKEYMLEHSKSALDLQHRFFYNKEDEACLEFTVKLKPGYTIDNPTWIGCTWGNVSGSIGNGEVNYTKQKNCMIWRNIS